MNGALQGASTRPEAMADVPGVCEMPLTRAVVQYRDGHEIEQVGGRIQDIGLALVLEGRYASSAEVVDLGSGDVKLLDLTAEVVLLDWVYEPTLEHVHELLAASLGDTGTVGRGADAARRPFERFCFRLGMRVLERIGFGPLTRPTLLRIGFRDICRDLDLHEGTSVRVALDGERLVRAHLDYDGNALRFLTPGPDPAAGVRDALAEAFPDARLSRIVPSTSASAGGYAARYVLPASLLELRTQLAEIRAGLVRLLGRFEPSRVREVEEVVGTFGRRETLARLDIGSGAAAYAAPAATAGGRRSAGSTRAGASTGPGTGGAATTTEDGSPGSGGSGSAHTVH